MYINRLFGFVTIVIFRVDVESLGFITHTYTHTHIHTHTNTHTHAHTHTHINTHIQTHRALSDPFPSFPFPHLSCTFLSPECTFTACLFAVLFTTFTILSKTLLQEQITHAYVLLSHAH